MAPIVVLDTVIPYILLFIFERRDAERSSIWRVAQVFARKHEAGKHAVVYFTINIFLGSIGVWIGAIIGKVDALTKEPEVSKADIETLFALVNGLGVSSTSARSMKQELYQLWWSLILVLLKVRDQLVCKFALNRLVFQLQNRMNSNILLFMRLL